MSSQASTHPFTCNTCQVAFRSSELQRTHMQSDWHRYNLKRRVASLPPLSSEIFAEKVLANKASAAATAARASFEKLCAACQKTYFSENAYQNHLNSQKHRQNALRAARLGSAGGKDDETASVMSSAFSLGEPVEAKEAAVPKEAEAEFNRVVDDMKKTTLEEGPVLERPERPHHSAADGQPEHSRTATEETAAKPEGPIVDCLFCNFKSPTFPLNIEHMERHHGMFIPEKPYLVDLEGLIGYLWEKIHEGHECLYCGKIVHTASGIQTHMRDRGHCMIAFSDETEMIEIGQFYDFRSTYSDEDEWSDASSETEDGNGGVKLGAARAEKTTITTEEGNQVMEDGAGEDGWETDSTVSDVPTDEITSVPIQDRSHRYKELHRHKHHSHTDPRPHRSVDGWHSHAHSRPQAVYYDDYELHLPSGRTAGHRSLRAYYRQNLRNYPTPEERAQQRLIKGFSDSDVEEEEERRPRGHDRGRQLVGRGNGGLGMVGVSDVTKKEVTAAEKREKKRELREKMRYQWGNDKRGNFQKHFRDPLLQ